MKDTTKYENFKQTGLSDFVQLKRDPLQFLVEEKGNLYVSAENGEKSLNLHGKLSRTKIKFDIQVKSNDEDSEWDCKVGNFSLNKWFRTEKGATGEKYKTLGLMLNAIEKGLKKHFSMTAVSYEIVLNKHRN